MRPDGITITLSRAEAAALLWGAKRSDEYQRAIHKIKLAMGTPDRAA